jgi:hypothetical protein
MTNVLNGAVFFRIKCSKCSVPKMIGQDDCIGPLTLDTTASRFYHVASSPYRLHKALFQWYSQLVPKDVLFVRFPLNAVYRKFNLSKPYRLEFELILTMVTLQSSMVRQCQLVFDSILFVRYDLTFDDAVFLFFLIRVFGHMIAIATVYSQYVLITYQLLGNIIKIVVLFLKTTTNFRIHGCL